MIVKICGIRDQLNYSEVRHLGVEMIGINFYSESKRFIQDKDLGAKENELRVGVFVKESMNSILVAKDKYGLDYAQLHGDEPIEFCKEVSKHLPVIKVFRIDDDFDWDTVKEFEFVDYFLFDTMTKKYGGSGRKFDWDKMHKYNLSVPFLLSGGIGPGDVEKVQKFRHPHFIGIDLNSKFEISPGLKDVQLIQNFINEITTIS